MQNHKQKLGKKGESIAEKMLKKNGYKILERNYRTPLGEIDIIAKNSDTIVFIEVKARTSNSFGSPKHAITETKKKRISKTALTYLKSTGQLHKRARFDVVAINPHKDNRTIEIIQNAFDLAYT